jgi:hypothetical protein
VDIGIFEVLLLLVVDLGTDAADDNIAIANCVADLPLRGKIIKSEEGLIAEISCSL